MVCLVYGILCLQGAVFMSTWQQKMIGENMQNRYVADEAKVGISSLAAETVMKNTPVQTVKSILGRIGIEYEDGLPKEAYITAFKEEFCSEPKWVLLMLPKEMLDFLMEVWDNSAVTMTEEQWNYVEYLKIFGFIAYRMGNSVSDEPNQLFIVQEMKDNFYFLLKSKKNQKILSLYEEWEKLITGFMYYYGFIETKKLYSLFLKVSKKVVSYEEFLLFIKCRSSLWSFGVILKDISEENEYFQTLSVENADLLLQYIRQHSDLPYKTIKEEDLIYVSDAAGIDNRWPGVSELGNLLIDKMGLNYYRATVLVRTLLIMIKNGCSYDKLDEKISVLSFETPLYKEEAKQAIRQLFENVPIFEYKGYSRAEYNRLSYRKQLKKRKNLFTIIDGGRK